MSYNLPIQIKVLLFVIRGSVTYQMPVPVPSISCCVLDHHNLFYQIYNALAFNRDTCCHLVLCSVLLPFHLIHKVSYAWEEYLSLNWYYWLNYVVTFWACVTTDVSWAYIEMQILYWSCCQIGLQLKNKSEKLKWKFYKCWILDIIYLLIVSYVFWA